MGLSCHRTWLRVDRGLTLISLGSNVGGRAKVVEIVAL